MTLGHGRRDRSIVGDRSGMGDTRPVMSCRGMFGLAAELGFDTVVFEELTAIKDRPVR